MTGDQSLAFRKLDHKDEVESEQIRQLFFDSYSVEAQVIGVRDFPPVRRTREDIVDAGAIFHGAFVSNRLCAVCELEYLPDDSINIAGFAVLPELFRRGIGSRFLDHLICSCGCREMTVSTAAANRPAIALYQKFSFSSCRNWETPCGIQMVTLRRTRA